MTNKVHFNYLTLISNKSKCHIRIIEHVSFVIQKLLNKTVNKSSKEFTVRIFVFHVRIFVFTKFVPVFLFNVVPEIEKVEYYTT
jgi:hypothetical protein